MSTNSQTEQSRIPAQSPLPGELTLNDVAAHTGIPRDRIRLWQSGGTALRKDEEEKLFYVFRREHERHSKAVEGKE